MVGGACSWSLKMETLVLGRGGSWSRGRRATYWSGGQLGGNKEKQNQLKKLEGWESSSQTRMLNLHVENPFIIVFEYKGSYGNQMFDICPKLFHLFRHLNTDKHILLHGSPKHSTMENSRPYKLLCEGKRVIRI